MYHPLRSLREGNWFKLICGASFQHLPAVRTLTLAYALAGVDCVDVAADPAVVAAARDAVWVASELRGLAQQRGFGLRGLPWLMVSLNDGDDPHFRKAEFDPARCPENCPRPCEMVCPAQAIAFNRAEDGFSGVIDSHCYGCGRCLPTCPTQQISTRSYVSTAAAIAPLVLAGVDAVEIHTQVGRLKDFNRLWQAIVPFLDQLKLISISCPDGVGVVDYLWALYDQMHPLPCALIWQTDGRPMSGDIGDGATRAAVKLGQKVLAAGLPGYVQLAGGTNRQTVEKLRALGLLNAAATHGNYSWTTDEQHVLAPHWGRSPQNPHYIAGVAYGSYARALLSPVLDQLEKGCINDSMPSANVLFPMVTLHNPTPLRLEAHDALLWQAVNLADSLVSQLKAPRRQQQLTQT